MARLGWSAVLVCGAAACSNFPPNVVDALRADAIPADAAPAAVPDVRFKWVGAFASYNLVEQDALAGSIANTLARSPANVGGGDVDWVAYAFTPSVPVEPLSSAAISEPSTSAMFAIEPLWPTTVITSLDYSADARALTTSLVPAQRIANAARQAATVDELADTVARGTATGLVYTALATGSAGVELYAYAYADDTLAYETSVMTSDDSELATTAVALATAGYIITAFGRTTTATTGTAAASYALIGTRVVGSSATHTAMLVTDDLSDAIGTALGQGYAIVGGTVDPSTGGRTYIVER